MNSRIKCENCIYWEDLKEHTRKGTGMCLFLREKYEYKNNEYCGHFIDQETKKSYRDLYFEEHQPKCECLWTVVKSTTSHDGDIIEYPKSPPTRITNNCPIHAEGKDGQADKE